MKILNEAKLSILQMEKANPDYIHKLVYAVYFKLGEYSKVGVSHKPNYDACLTPALIHLKNASPSGTKIEINRILDAIYVCERFIKEDIYFAAVTTYFRKAVKWELITKALNPGRLLRVYDGDYNKVADYLIELG